MFSKKQTRLILALTIIMPILICAIALNWNKEQSSGADTTSRLELPEHFKEKVKERVSSPGASPQAPTEPEKEEENDEGTIILF